MKRTGAILTLVLFTVLVAPPAAAYSVLTHEAIIDSAWDTDIKPRLHKRFPAGQRRRSA